MTRKILFLCVGNSCRSQMAEGWARHLVRERGLDVEVKSGGTVPSGRIHPDAIDVMAERGIDIGTQSSGLMDMAFAEAADVVVTMGCSAEDGCPARILPKVVDWALEDPDGRDLAFFRTTRDTIEARVRALLGLP